MNANWEIGKVKADIGNAVLAGLEACGVVVEGDAIHNCPVHDGLLRMSLYRKLQRASWSIIVGASAAYAAAVEYGRKPGKMPPVEALKKWAKDILGNEAAAFPLARKIARAGTKAQPYLRPAFDKWYGQFDSIMARFIKNVTG